MALTFSIQSSALPLSARVAGFRGTEGLSRPYEFDVWVAVPGDADVELEDVVGSKASLILTDGLLPVQHHQGVLASFEMVRALEGHTLYRARIVPRLWQLSLTRHSRVFTKKSIPEVIEAVLQEEGIEPFELRLKESYPVEEHVTQYRESSLTFLHRWMEREGLYYFFEQTDDGEKLVIVDHLGKHEAIATGPVRYHPTSSKDGGAGRHFDNFLARHASLPATVKLTDYDYLRPTLDVAGSASVHPSGFGEQRLYGGRFFAPADGARVARVRAEELRAAAATYHATGAALGLAPGLKFTLELHPRGAMNKEYLLTAVEHHGYVADLANLWGDLVEHVHDDVYRVTVSAVLAEQQYRHPSTAPWPRIDGYENGVVDGAASSEYAQIDADGRYLVKFKFDEGTLKDGKASTYVRMMQPHGGTTEGWHFPLRKGTEIVFFFLGGDPDRPVIAGAIPNAHTPSPVVASNHTQNIIQTGGANYITIEDQAGSQYINLFTPSLSTNLYLGIDREVGAQGLTCGSGPDAVEKGEYKKELGPFHFQLATKGSGELFTEGNLNLVANGNMQLEGQSGMYQYAKNELKLHVDGITEEHRTGKFWQKLDDVVDMDWKGNWTLDVEKDSAITLKGTKTEEVTKATSITNKSTFTQVNKGASSVSDVSGLTHFVGGEANMCGADTHTLKVTGTQGVNVSGNQTVHVGGNQTWTTGGALDWKITGPHSIESATWHENVWGAKSEHVYGIKNDLVIGLHTDNHIGLHQEAHLVGHIDLNAAIEMSAFLGVRVQLELAAGIEVSNSKIEQKPLKMTSTALRLEQIVSRISTHAVRIVQGFHVIT